MLWCARETSGWSQNNREESQNNGESEQWRGITVALTEEEKCLDMLVLRNTVTVRRSNTSPDARTIALPKHLIYLCLLKYNAKIKISYYYCPDSSNSIFI